MKIGFVPLYEYIIEIEVYDDIINYRAIHWWIALKVC